MVQPSPRAAGLHMGVKRFKGVAPIVTPLVVEGVVQNGTFPVAGLTGLSWSENDTILTSEGPKSC